MSTMMFFLTLLKNLLWLSASMVFKVVDGIVACFFEFVFEMLLFGWMG